MSLNDLITQHSTQLVLNPDKFAQPAVQTRTGWRKPVRHEAVLYTWLQQSWDTSRGQESKQQAEVYLAESCSVESGDVFVLDGVTTVVTALGDVSYGLRRFTVETRKPVSQHESRSVR